MARPTRTPIPSGMEGWDAAVDDNFATVFDTPHPPARYADTGSLPDANLYDGCIAEVTGTGLYISEGGAWKRIPVASAAITNPTGWADTTARTWAQGLLDALRASGAIAT
jgi:hypothetical protein